MSTACKHRLKESINPKRTEIWGKTLTPWKFWFGGSVNSWSLGIRFTKSTGFLLNAFFFSFWNDLFKYLLYYLYTYCYTKMKLKFKLFPWNLFRFGVKRQSHENLRLLKIGESVNPVKIDLGESINPVKTYIGRQCQPCINLDFGENVNCMQT